MRAHDCLRDREPESRPLRRCRGLVVGLEELVEDVRYVLRWNPCARIAHLHANRVVRSGNRQLDRPATFRELEGVRQQVAEYFTHAVFVPDDLIGESGSAVHIEPHTSLNGEHAERRLELGEEWSEMHCSELELASARL